MNVPSDIAHKVVDQLRGTPFVLALLVINVVVLAGFAFTLHEVSSAMEQQGENPREVLQMKVTILMLMLTLMLGGCIVAETPSRRWVGAPGRIHRPAPDSRPRPATAPRRRARRRRETGVRRAVQPDFQDRGADRRQADGWAATAEIGVLTQGAVEHVDRQNGAEAVAQDQDFIGVAARRCDERARVRSRRSPRWVSSPRM